MNYTKKNTFPIFTSSFSIGRSVLTFEDPQKTKKDGANSILSIVKDNGLKFVFLLEDSFICFKKASEALDKLGCQLIYGIRFNICNNRLELDPKIKEESAHKISIFAKNDAGCKDLIKLFSHVQVKCGGFLDYQLLKERYTKDFFVAVQFYDSFIHKNSFFGKKCLPDLSFCDPSIWVADHGLPFDNILREKVIDFAHQNAYSLKETHHIYYKNPEDSEAMIVLKILTNRQGGKAQTLDRPELNGYGSDNFNWKDYCSKVGNSGS